MHIDCLPNRTQEALARVQKIPSISKYVLIGGTALALQASHRVSEDLDFVTLGGALDRQEVETIIEAVSVETPTLVTSAAARDDMELAGLDIDDSHQDWLVDGVKITFFAPDSPSQRAVYDETPVHRLNNVHLLDEAGIFRLKSMVVMDRRTSRDLFDLWFFLDQRGRTISDILAAMDHRKQHRTLDDLLQMIAPRSLPIRDPGFASSFRGAPQNSDELLERMAAFAAEYRRQIAAREIRAYSKGPHDPRDVGRGR